MGAVPPNHAPRRAEVKFQDPARQQIRKLTAAQTGALDRAIVAISMYPDFGTPQGPFRDYRDDLENVRVLYLVRNPHLIVVYYVEA